MHRAQLRPKHSAIIHLVKIHSSRAGRKPIILQNILLNKRAWQMRWAQNGGRLFAGRMIARKDDPIWTKISTFGVPYPSFDFNSGMGVRDISRREAIRLGVIAKEDETPRPQSRRLTENVEMRLPENEGLAASFLAAFQERLWTTAKDAKLMLMPPEKMQFEGLRSAFEQGKFFRAKLAYLPSESLSKIAEAGLPSPSELAVALSTDEMSKILRDHGENGLKLLPGEPAVTVEHLRKSVEAIKAGKIKKSREGGGSLEAHAMDEKGRWVYAFSYSTGKYKRLDLKSVYWDREQKKKKGEP